MRSWEGQKRAPYPQISNDLSTEHTNIIVQSPKYDKVDIPISRHGPDKKLGTKVFKDNDDIKVRFTYWWHCL